MAYYLYKTCDTCGGDGIVTSTYPPGSVPCWQCNGLGKLSVGELPEIETELVSFREDLQAYLVDWKTDEVGAFTTVIQKLNQILNKLP